MKVIGLTGGIAAGKTTVTEYLAGLGAVLIDADVISRQLLAPGSPVLAEIRRLFGSRYFDQDGNLQRKALGNLIFSDEKERSKLNNLMHPLIRQEIIKQIENYRRAGEKTVFLSAALLFETNLDELTDEIWVVALDKEKQVQRLMARDNLSREQALNRLAAQSSLEEKLKKADQIIDNNGAVEKTLEQIELLWRRVNG